MLFYQTICLKKSTLEIILRSLYGFNVSIQSNACCFWFVLVLYAWYWVICEMNDLSLFPQWAGSPCGFHGPYIFYKAFRFDIEANPRILSLGDFFLVRCRPGEPLCIAELQLLWEERTRKQLLSSSKLYFLPEDTPQGRTVSHGEVITHFLSAFILCVLNYRLHSSANNI
jgi:hypothetical protein